MMRFFILCTVLVTLACPSLARDIFVITAREPGLTPQDIAQHLESHGMPRGVLFAVSPPGTTTSAWRRITLEYRGKGGARVHLMRMNRPPFLVTRTPEVVNTLDHAAATFGFITVSDTGPVVRMKALVAGLLAVRGQGIVHDSRFGTPMPVALWDHQIKDEDFEFPMAVERAVLRCYSIPSTPVETASFRWIPTSIGAVAFDERNVVGVVSTAHLAAGSVESGRITTGGGVYRVFDMEKEWGSGKASPIASRYLLMNYERGGLALPAERLHGPIEVQDLHVQLVPPGAAAGSLPSLIVESGESIPAGGPTAFIWLGAGSGRDTATQSLIAIARAAMRGPYDRRENAIRATWRIPGPEAVELLTDIARGGSGEHLRTLALKGLAGRDDGHVALVELARGSRGREAPEAVQVLAGLKRADTGRVLVDTAVNENVGVASRREALMRLRTRVRPEHVPALRNLLGSGISVVRLLAADLILRVGPSPEARAVLVEELRGGVVDYDVVVPLLTRHQVTEAAPLLIARYPTVPVPVRHRIANALKMLAPTAVVSEQGVLLPPAPQEDEEGLNRNGSVLPDGADALPPPAAAPLHPAQPGGTLFRAPRSPGVPDAPGGPGGPATPVNPGAPPTQPLPGSPPGQASGGPGRSAGGAPAPGNESTSSGLDVHAVMSELSTVGVTSTNPRARRLAGLLAAPITVSAPASVGLAPLQVVQLLSGRGLPVGLGALHAGPQAAPAEWDTLTVKSQDARGNLASVTQARVPAATGGPARVAYALTCLAPGDMQALEATAWLAGLFAERTSGAIADAAGRTWSPAEWRREVLE